MCVLSSHCIFQHLQLGLPRLQRCKPLISIPVYTQEPLDQPKLCPLSSVPLVQELHTQWPTLGHKSLIGPKQMKCFSSQDGCVLGIGIMPEGLGLDTVSIPALAIICLLQKMIPRHWGSGNFLRPMCQ